MDEALFEALREHRLTLAQEQGVPPYIIFHDSTLEEMARTRPTRLEDLRYISGVGEQKLKRFGQSFLELISAHPLPELLDNRLSDTVNETLFLLAHDKDPDAIAQERGITLSTVYSHLADAIEVGLLNPRDVLPIDSEQYNEIINTMEMMDCDHEKRLKPVYEALEENYDYGILKCIQAGM
jgi:ATP-dependent DNA helicase RecQ